MTASSPLAITAATSDFVTLRREGGYYVDKTRYFRELVSCHFDVAQLMLRPRCFGKTLTLTALRAFMDLNYQHPGAPNDTAELFADLEISRDRELCGTWQSQTPVVYVSFHDIVQDNYDDACEALCRKMAGLAADYAFLADEPRLSRWHRERLIRMQHLADDDQPLDRRRMDMDRVLYVLAHCLHDVYGKRVMFFIDEYEMPLFMAANYSRREDIRRDYERMFDTMCGMLIHVCKTIDPAVGCCLLTSCRCTCLASWGSGINNFSWDTVEHHPHAELMGFTPAEVRTLLADHGLEERFDEARAWYGGYRCGPSEIFSPGSLIRYCLQLQSDPRAAPRSFRAQAVPRDLPPLNIDDGACVSMLQDLLDGRYLPIRELMDNLPFDRPALDVSRGRCWSSPRLLSAAGYIAWQGPGRDMDEYRRPLPLYRLPNREIVECMCRPVQEYYREGALHAGTGLARFIAALFSGDEKGVGDELRLRPHSYLRLPQAATWQPRPRPEQKVMPDPDARSRVDRTAHGLDCPHLTHEVLHGCEDVAVTELCLDETGAAEELALSCTDARDPRRGCLMLFIRVSLPPDDPQADYDAQLDAWSRMLKQAAGEALERACDPSRTAPLFSQHPQLQQLACYGISWDGSSWDRKVRVQLVQRDGAARS